MRLRPLRPRPFALGLALAAAALVAVSCSVAPSRPVALATGEKIYRQKCADCHGATGQGVPDEYADALTGDWSLPRLTRYVATTMPDDKPGSLSRAEADAVSTYIYDQFYSPAAQARLRPARVALAHLTNRQYAVIVADLLRSLAPATTTDAAPADSPRGLAATYFSVAQRGRFDPAKLAHRGTDATVDFVFPENGELRARLTLPPLDRPPTPNSREPAGFSAQWRGTVFADETGDHEFIIHTPNSVRVWINADPEPRGATEPPTLDINVSTPKTPDHRVTLRLLGGRSYPIAIDWWALPEKTGSPVVPAISLRWKPPHGSERPIPARNLSTAKTAPTFVVATRFPADDASHGYERSTSVSKAWDEATTSAAFEITNHVLKRLDRFAGTRPDDPARAKKIAAFAEKFTAAAFRRPLSPEETQRHVTTLLRDAPDPENGLRRVLLLALKSPHFLYTELPYLATSPSPAPTAPPAAHHIATRLAFALWDSAPDRDLTAAASSGRLLAHPEVTAQARRLLADPRARAKLREFFAQWLQIRYVEDLSKNATLYPAFTPELIDDLRTSLTLFVEDVVWSERSDYRELLRADYLYANDRLATFYNLPAPASALGDFVRVPAPAGQRSGVLTHPYLLAALSYKTTSSPIHRGVFLTRSIVGRALKPPPEAQTFDETTFAPDLTMRQKVEKLTRSENCQGCHAVINPLGFSLEHFDAVGRYRTTDNGRPIDAASDYGADELAKPVRLASARDVADFALANARSNEAFIEQLFHHLVKQPAAAFGPDTLARLRDSFIASHYNIQNLLVEIATLAALRDAAPATLSQRNDPLAKHQEPQRGASR
jgi:mono/diheme cytochrome c family protein